MKLFNNKQMLLRIIAAAAEAILFYIGYLLLTQLLPCSRINIIFFIITAIAGLYINTLPYNNANKRQSTYLFGFVGLALAITAVAVSSTHDFYLATLPAGFITLLALYYRSYTNYLAGILYVYTIGSFYQNVTALFVVNFVVTFYPGLFGLVASEVMRFSIFYIMIALYMLSKVKSFRYVNKSENQRRNLFETAATGLMIVTTVIMSIPSVFKAVTHPFIVVFQFVYGWVGKLVLLITYPIAALMGYLFNLIVLPDKKGRPKASFEELLGMSEKYGEKSKIADNQFLQIIGKTLTFVLLLAVCVYAVYLLFRVIDRYTRSEEEEDFIEDKEFVLGKNKNKAPGVMSRLGGSLKKAAGNLAFMLTANNADKLRNEYKNFIQKLHSKEIIEHYNYTAQDILELLFQKVSEQQPSIADVTAMYEDVRYGVKYPEDIELKMFRKNLAEISKAIQLLE